MADTITIEEWRDHLKRAVNTGALAKGIRIAAVELALEGKRHAQFGVTNRAGGLRVRSGRLRGSIQGNVTKTGPGADVILSAGGSSGRGTVKYARIHEAGGTIFPKRAKYLTFPVSADAFTGAGVSRGAGGSSWRSVRSVKIPARPYMQPALEHIARLAPAHIARTVQRVLDGP